MSYDPKCEDLARHFAQAEAQVSDLADAIQAAVEAWFLLAPPKPQPRKFIEALNKADTQLPWDADAGQVVDASGYLVCACVGSHGKLIAEMIVLAVNACGSLRATRRD